MSRGLRALIGRLHPRFAVVAHDLFMVWLAWSGAMWVRYSIEPSRPDWASMGIELAIVLGAQALAFWWTGLYRGLWRFASLPDLTNILRACVFGSLIAGLGLFLYNRLDTTPRAVLVMYPPLLFVLLGAPRLLYRYWKDSRLDFYARDAAKRVLVLGAGRAGELLVRDIKREGRYTPVGFLDDNRLLRGAKLHGIPVLGSLDALQEVAREAAAEMLLIAMPSASNAQMQRVVEICEASGVPFRTVPRLQDVVSGRSSFNELKEVAIEDLLGRDPVVLDWTAIRSEVSGRSVLVTGGGGSIGGELCRQVARLGAGALTIIELSEYNLYRIERELRRECPDLILNLVLGDVCDPAVCDHALMRYRPQVVFHAAAYKHVPMLETRVREAIRNNVLGTQTLALASDRHQVATFVLISTDKAVNPANVLGASKRAAELVCQGFASRSATRFVTVRFGNVLDSAGSVVPLFREQLSTGGPLTVTHPEVSRYFMTIAEACQLILQASVLGRGGEIFVLDMGEPVRIAYLAEQMIRLANKVPGRDVQIVYTGLRPGEKLFEELFHEQEAYAPTRHRKILLAQSRQIEWEQLLAQVSRMAAGVRNYDEPQLLALLRELVPEFAAPVPLGDVVPLHRIPQN